MQDLDIQLNASNQFLLIISLIMLGTILIILLLPLKLWIKFLLALVSIVYGFKTLIMPSLLRSNMMITGIRSLKGSLFELKIGERIVQGEILGDSTITRLMCVLRFKIEGERLAKSCLIWHDALSPLQYRRLRLYLRCLIMTKVPTDVHYCINKK